MSLVDDDRFAMPADGSAADAPAVDQQVDAPVTTTADPGTAEAPEAGAAEEPTVTFGDLGLHQDIVRALAKRGVTTPFPIQAATIPDALAGKDVLGRGRTGSGKTLSFGLPLLTRLAEGRTRAKRPRGLILVPTRELAMQVSDALEPYGSVLGLNLKVVCGGTSMPRQIYALERGVDVLVATPGRLRDLIDRGAATLDEVQIAVLDEADQMADMGFLPEVTEILDLVPAGGQRMLFSATLENEIDTLVKRYLQNPVTHEVDPSAGAVTTMTHHILVVKPKDKAPITSAIAARKGRTIIFVRTQMGADRVAEQLREAGVRADALHGGMTQGARTRTLGDFKDGYVHVLVATDVAARGIHVDGIDLVLNVDPAGDHKDYLHRSGRTARAGRSGIVVTLALPHQRRGVFRLMEDAGVDASRHVVGGSFDADVARITGARSLTEVQAEGAAGAAKAAEREVEDLARRLEKLQRRAAELREDADRLAARAARERAELGIEDEPSDAVEAPAAEADAPVAAPADTDAAPSAAPAAEEAAPAADAEERTRPFNRDRDDRGGRSFERRDDRGGFSRDRGGDRPFNRDRDDRGGRSFERRDDRGGFSRDRGGDRPFNRDRDDRGGRVRS
ncbi:DEAD/DEAH box helicase, partial [Streptomyces sp. NPDC001380]|uniref:DEAD/DEAH box helicase n=1 Tax=Streptomyces sp. NPDC001380 TaxID=3364566 RepID=UPI0036B400A1